MKTIIEKMQALKEIRLTHANNLGLEHAASAMEAYGIKNQNYFGILFEAGKRAANKHKDNYYEANKAASYITDKKAKQIHILTNY